MKRLTALLIATALCAPTLASERLLIEHVHGATLDRNGQLQRFSALLIEDGKVLATGASDELRKQAGTAKVIDAQGRYLLPGLIDAHGHVLGLGALRRQADLTGTATLADALARVRAYAASHRGDAWLLGRGWNQVSWKLGHFPSASDLDAVVSEQPVWLERVDGHAAWANHAAMARAGITRDTPDPAGGRIERDANGEPTGVFVDGAMDLVAAHIAKPSPAQQADMLDAALAEMARLGLTGVGDAGIDAETYALYRRYAESGKLTARIYAMIGGTGADFAAISADGPVLGLGNDTLTVRSVKLYADGALGSRGAAMLAPYADAPSNRGLLFNPPDVLTGMIDTAIGRGYQVCVHAIGDASNREVLDAFTSVYARHPDAATLRNRIEHAQVLALEDIPRFPALGLIASMQPTHATSDMNMAEDRIGPERIQGAYAWQRFVQQGTVIAGGSDFPVESANPFLGLHAAVTRQDSAGQPPGGWYPEQALSVTQALRAFTLDAAYAEHAETRIGTLEPGKWADFILVDQDIFAVAPENIWRTRVLATWLAGRPIYRAEQP